nr:MAG TPA: phosphoprotein [Microviridae sp.]
MRKETISLSPKNQLNVVENERIKESPFSVCGNKEQGFVLTVGRNLISNRIFQTKEEAMDYCKPKNMTWDDLLVAISVVVTHIIKNQKHEEK